MPTGGPGDATEIGRRVVEEGADLVLVLGGDGTINEVVNGLAGSKVPLAVLPGGTANVLAMELGLGPRSAIAAEKLSGCEEKRVALGRLCDPRGQSRYFLLMGGAGLDATIVTKVNAEFKAKAGKLAYWAAGFTQFVSRVEQFEVRVNGRGRKVGFVLVSRVRNYGGDLEIASGASLLRDDFEIVMFEGSNPLRYAGYMMAVAARRVQSIPGVHTVRGACVELGGEAHIQVDGEYAGRTPARMEIVPDALTLLVPKTYR